ncbi:MAG: glycosyltransferase [Kiritimatiellae bacterium]|nr:glycosyltransferase [Kiritimatiellia bacterium]
MSRVDQLLDGFVPGDAISQEALAVRAHLRHLGFDSEIFAVPQRISPDGLAECRPVTDIETRRPDAVILHYAIASPAADVWRAGAFRRLLLYHNITPSEWFRPYDAALSAQLQSGRRALPDLVSAAHAMAAVSSFNANELRAVGADRVRLLPLVSAAEPLPPPDPSMTARLGDGFTNLLHIGRLAPNKCLEELIEGFVWYQRGFNPRSRLILAGSDRACPRYAALLRMLLVEYKAENVWLAGYLTEAQLSAALSAASLVISVSRHEGFCAPLVTAARAGVPVLARAIGGVPEAVGPAALLFDEASPRELAALIHIATTDAAVRSAIAAGQRQRLAQLHRRDVATELLNWLADAGLAVSKRHAP